MNIGRSTIGLVTGIIFGLGLAVSQMTNPEKVLSFLTLVRGWDPSLLLVMGAALMVTFAGYKWAFRSQPLFADKHFVSANRMIDYRLLLGAVIFGIGWGLAGFCPGPAIAGLASGSAEPFVFLLSMLVGAQVAKALFPT